MLDSANDTIEQLKAEVADMQGEVEDARRMAEDMEGQLRAVHEQDGTEKSNLRCGAARGAQPMPGVTRVCNAQSVSSSYAIRVEIEAGEAALEQVSASLAEAQARLQEAEGKQKSAQGALAEKEAMINYVNEEVDRVKGERSEAGS